MYIYKGDSNETLGMTQVPKEEIMDADQEFNALWVEEQPGGGVTRQVIRRKVGDLPPGDLLVRVRYSSLNYKDALSASGNRGVTRKYPHTPGIDAAGEVVESTSPNFQSGDRVIVMDFDLGANTPGGYGQFIRVPAGWAMHLPEGITLEQSMAYGTAGLTAALSIDKLLKQGVSPGQGEVLVTGSTGGVGIFAVGMLAHQGFQVVAVTGKSEKADFLRRHGANRVIPRAEASDESGKPLLHAYWAGVVDTVGGNYLATALKTILPGGAVTCCGNVASPELHTTVFPFILRGISLLGIDVSQTPMEYRKELWAKITGSWAVAGLDELYRVVPVEELEPEIEKILKGGQSGRVVVKL